MKHIPQCRECKRHIFIGSELGLPPNICTHPNIAYTGDLISTVTAREMDECGLEGKLFEPKPPEPKSWLSRLFGG